MTLKEFCKMMGSQEKASAKIGITLCNLNRILNGHQKASPLTIQRLKQLKVTMEKIV